jgi:predicted transposase YbfD/YdcC
LSCTTGFDNGNAILLLHCVLIYHKVTFAGWTGNFFVADHNVLCGLVGFFLRVILTQFTDLTHYLKSIGVVECERIIHGKTSIEQRHYITTVTDVATFAHAARAHWGIENSLHWFWMSPSKKMTLAFALDMPLKI